MRKSYEIVTNNIAANIMPSAQNHNLACVTLLVQDYDAAIEFFTAALKFTLVEDTKVAAGKRWVVVAPQANGLAQTTALLLAKASTPEQLACVGNQAGGRVFMFLHTSDFAADHAHMLASGVRFLEAPRLEAYGTVAVFVDVSGNKWDLIEPSTRS